MTRIKAVYEDGVFKPSEPVSLEEHSEVEVVVPERGEPDPADPTGWKAIRRLIGAGKSITPDGSENHDRYLYDDPSD